MKKERVVGIKEKKEKNEKITKILKKGVDFVAR